MANVLIGLNDQKFKKKFEGLFEWITNHDSKYTNWDSGQPDGYSNSNEDCVVMHYYGDYCFSKLYFICKIP